MQKKKIALVTGGSRGLGKDMVLNLAKKGIVVIFTFHSNKIAADNVLAEAASTGQKVKAFQLDTSNTKSFDEFFKQTSTYLTAEYGNPKFDFLINNAGTGLYQPFDQMTEDQFDEMLNVHYKGVYFLTQKALKFINDEGRIVNVSSGLTRTSFPGSSAYACMKGAVEVLTRYLAKELGARKISVNVIAPGAIATDFGGGSNRDNEEKRKIIASVTALGRVGEAEDIGGIVAFLCSDEARWINGQRIEVSGGMVL